MLEDNNDEDGNDQWRRQLVGTWARAPPLAFERIFSLG